MNTSKIEYAGNLRTKLTHLLSGDTVITDAPLDNNGKGEAFSPTDLVATALGSCMVTIMGITARNHNFSIDGTKIDVTKIMATSPRRIGEIIIDIHFPKEIEYTDKQKKLLLASAKTCPVAQSLHPDVKQNISFNFS